MKEKEMNQQQRMFSLFDIVYCFNYFLCICVKREQSKNIRKI